MSVIVLDARNFENKTLFIQNLLQIYTERERDTAKSIEKNNYVLDGTVLILLLHMEVVQSIQKLLFVQRLL